jgi:pimeloyl-ACP methyl ester carboxylesterase
MRKNWQQASAIAFNLFLLSGVLACRAPAAKPQQSPLRRVDIDGHALQLRVLGRGGPLVVLESGLGDAMEPWEKVQPKVAEFTQVVAYDRAGLGQSESGPKPRTALQITKELHAALQGAHLSPPYVLVAHSAAGFYIRVFAKTYPTEVAGMVFVDPTPEGFFDRLAAIQSPKERRDFAQQIEQYLSRASEGRKAEWAALPEQAEEAHAAWPLPDVPVILITGMKNEPDKSPEAKQLWLRMQNEWLKRVPNAKHIVTQKSGHYVQLEEPELVVKAIKEVAKAAMKESLRQ